MFHQKQCRKKKLFTLRNVGSGNINLGIGDVKILVLMVLFEKYNNYVRPYPLIMLKQRMTEIIKMSAPKKCMVEIILRKISNQKIVTGTLPEVKNNDAVFFVQF